MHIPAPGTHVEHVVVEEKFELSQKQEPSRMPPMRRVAAAIAVSALVGSTALPALAALCCASAPSHACCTKSGEDRATALEHAPCCKIAVAVKVAAREQVPPPRGSSDSTVAIPAVSSQPAILRADARAPACMKVPASSPHGPPLRLRI
jgi:hypothetical protein